MLPRTGSSRRRRASRSLASSPARCPGSGSGGSSGSGARRRASIAVSSEELGPPQTPLLRSPRGSVTEEDAGLDPRFLSPYPRSSPRASRASLAPELEAYLRSPRGSLAPDPGLRSPCRSPRGSLVPEVTPSRSPRGSIASEAGSRSRSHRGSIPQELGALSPRGSVDNTPAGRSGRSPSPYRSSRGSQGYVAAENFGSRRPSSSVSGDDRRQLCEERKQSEPGSITATTTYGSLVYQLNTANIESSGLSDFLSRATGILYRTVVVTVVLTCLTSLPVTMFIIGIQFVKDCPVEPHIPVYMIVGGALGSLWMVWTVWSQVRSRRYERLAGRPREDSSATSKIARGLLTLFLLAWFGLGNLWILGIYLPEFEPTLYEPDRWCHKTLYVFSLVHLVAMYSILGSLLLFFLSLVACQLCLCPILISCK